MALDLKDFLANGGDQKLIDDMVARLIRARSAKAEYFPAIWTVRVGELPAPRLVIEVERGGARFTCDRTRSSLRKAPISPILKDVRLVMPSLGDLGFTRGEKNMMVILPRAMEYGLRELTLEEVMLFRREYRTQPEGEEIDVAMETLDMGSQSPPVRLLVRRIEDQLRIESRATGMGERFPSLGQRMVFAIAD